jgi:hypothetical protein
MVLEKLSDDINWTKSICIENIMCIDDHYLTIYNEGEDDEHLMADFHRDDQERKVKEYKQEMIEKRVRKILNLNLRGELCAKKKKFTRCLREIMKRNNGQIYC